MIPVILTPDNARATVMDDEGRPCVRIEWDEDRVPLDADTCIILDADLRGLTSDTVLVHDAMSYRDTSFIVVQRDGKFRFESRPDTLTLYKLTFNDGADYF